MKKEELIELETAPVVFAVGREYQIMVPAKSDILFWVVVDGVRYSDHINGIMRSNVRIHRVHVPQKALDTAGCYTVCYRKIIERKPYFTTTEDTVSAHFAFRTVKDKENIKIYQLADTHGDLDHAVAAGSYFGDELDLLIMNGDIPDHGGYEKNYDLIYKIAGAVTGGEIPVVLARGNHDTRGFFAEKYHEYTPTENGRSYYTFRLGPVWGIVLDCGEDKEDGHEAYGYTAAFSEFRKEETSFLESVAADPEEEYRNEGVKYRLVVVHSPFSFKDRAPFNIEEKLYTHWLDVLKEKIRPDLMLSSHVHECVFSPVGSSYDHLGQPCPVVIGDRPVTGEDGSIIDIEGTALILNKEGIDILFTNSRKDMVESHHTKL